MSAFQFTIEGKSACLDVYSEFCIARRPDQTTRTITYSEISDVEFQEKRFLTDSFIRFHLKDGKRVTFYLKRDIDSQVAAREAFEEITSLVSSIPIPIKTKPEVNNSEAPITVKKYSKPTWNLEYEYIYDDVDACILKENAPDFSLLSFKEPLIFVQELTNDYDPNAVKIMQGELFVGYLYKNRLQDMVNDFLKKGHRVYGKIVLHNQSKNKVKIMLMFPYRTQPNFKEFKLTGNRNSNMQDNLNSCDVNDMVEVDYDLDKEKYLAVCEGLEIGYMPQSADKYLDEAETIEAVLSYLEIDDNDKYCAKVTVRAS